MSRKVLLSIAIWGLALGLAGWLLRQIPLADLTAAVSALGPAQWGLWIGLNTLVIALLTARWRVLARSIGLDCGFLSLLRLRQAGQLISFVTPGPQFGGEPLQVYWLWRRYKMAAHTAVLAVGFDRFYELWINFAVLLVAVLALATSSTLPSANWPTIITALGGAVMAMLALGWLLWQRPAMIRNWIDRAGHRWQHHPRLRHLETHWTQANDLLQSTLVGEKAALLAAVWLSLLAWAAMMAEFWYVLSLSGVQVTLTSFVFCFTMVRLAFLLPLPGGIGSVEAAMLWSFQSLNLPLASAVAAIALMRSRDVLILLSGALALPGLGNSDSVPAPAASGRASRVE